MFKGKKLEVIHLKIFGFPVYVHIPKENRIKLNPSGKKGIFVGYCEVSKAFKIYIPEFPHMEISRDVTFDEEATLKRSKKCQHEELYEEDARPKNAEATFLPKNEAPKDHGMIEPQEPPTMEISRKRNIAWEREIIQEAKRYGAPEGSTTISKRPKPFSNYVSLMCDLVDQETTNYEEALHKI